MKLKILHIILIIAFYSAHAQVKEENFLLSLQEKLAWHQQNNPSSKLYLKFNQPQYASGDTVYYQATSFFAQTKSKRQIITVALSEQNGKNIYSQKILLIDAAGYNQFVIPQGLEPGVYVVTAYSDDMKNYSPEFFFYANLYVSVEPSSTGVSKTFMCFPEGGNFIEGINNKVGIAGPPYSVGNIVDQQGLSAATFRLDSSGLGSVYIIPEAGKHYKATSGSTVSQIFPEAAIDGIAMLTNVPSGNGTLRFVLQLNEASVWRKEKFYFAMMARGVLHYSAELSFTDKSTLLLQVPNTTIPNGLAVAVIFNSKGEVVSERLCRIDHQDKPEVRIQLEKNLWSTRENGVASIRLTNSSGNPVNASLNVSVYQSDLYEEQGSHINLKNYLELLSDLPFGGLLSGVPPDHNFTSWDNFLITKKWKRFQWADVWLEKKNKGYVANAYLRFAGKVKYLNGDKPFPDSTRISFFLQRDITSYQTFINSHGEFSTPVLDFWNDDEVYCRVEHKGKPLTDIRITWDGEDDVTLIPSPAIRKPSVSRYGQYVLQAKEIDQSFEFFSRKDSVRKEVNVHSLLEDEVAGVDAHINLSDYLLFPDMEETLREVVPFVQHRKQSGKSVIRVWMDQLDRLAEGDPLLIIDGIITDDTDYFMSLKPENVSVIKIIFEIDKLKVFGASGRNGVILVETKIFNNRLHVPTSKNSFFIHGLTPASTWKFSEHKNSFPRTPDLRTSLYWNPFVKANERGEARISFPASDNIGRFKIQVEGVSEDGPVQGEAWFDVVFKKESSH